MNNVVIGQGKLHDKGVYADREFKKGDVVVSYNLSRLSRDDFMSLPSTEKDFVHSHHGTLYLYSEPERYVNHSDTPNTYQDIDRKCDIALRKILKGEMITTDARKDDVK